MSRATPASIRVKEATRKDIEPFEQIAFDMRYVRRFDERDGNDWPVYGVFYVDDLRPKQERGGGCGEIKKAMTGIAAHQSLRKQSIKEFRFCKPEK
jgi:hypothetical protein